MKNFKKVVFSMLAMLVMVTGAKAIGYDGCKEVDENHELTGDVCTIQTNETFDADLQITKNITIVTNEHTLTINNNLTIEDGVTLTIKGGNVKVTNNVSSSAFKVLVKDNASLIITGNDSDDYNPLTVSTSNVTFEVRNGGTLSVSDNKNTKTGAFIVDSNGVGSKMELNHAKLLINNNDQNGMNAAGSMTITANYSEIEANNNSQCGIGANFSLYSSKVTATGNGLSGVTLGSTSIDSASEVNAKGNLVSTDKADAAKIAQKADVVLHDNVTVNGGKLIAGSVALEKETWKSTGNVASKNLTVDGSGVKVDEFKSMCTGNGVTACVGDSVKPLVPVAATNKYAVVTEGDKAYIYTNGTSNAEITLDSSYDNVVVTAGANMKKLTVAPGTTVTNGTGTTLYVYETGADRPVAVPAKEEGKDPVPTVVGTKPATDPTPGTPGEGQGEPTEPGDAGNTGSTGEGSTGDNTTGTNPGTFDGIASFVTLAISSLSAAGYSIKKIVRR